MDLHTRVNEWDDAAVSAAICSANTDVNDIIAKLNLEHASRMATLTTSAGVERLGSTAPYSGVAESLLRKVYQTPHQTYSSRSASRHLVSPSAHDDNEDADNVSIPARDRDLSRVSRRLAPPSVLDDLSLEELKRERQRQLSLLQEEERKRDEAYRRLEAYRQMALDADDASSSADSLPAVSAVSGQPSRRTSNFVAASDSGANDRVGLVRSPAPEVPALNLRATQLPMNSTIHVRKASDSPPDLAETWPDLTPPQVVIDDTAPGNRGGHVSKPRSHMVHREPWRGGGVAPARTLSPPRPSQQSNQSLPGDDDSAAQPHRVSTFVKNPLQEQARLRREYRELAAQPMSPRDIAALISPNGDALLTRKESGIFNPGGDEESILGLNARNGTYRDPLFVHAPFGYNQHTGQTARGELRVGGTVLAPPESGMIRSHSDSKLGAGRDKGNSKHGTSDRKSRSAMAPTATSEKASSKHSEKEKVPPEPARPRPTTTGTQTDAVPASPPPPSVPTPPVPLPPPPAPAAPVALESPRARGTGVDDSGNAADFFDPTASIDLRPQATLVPSVTEQKASKDLHSHTTKHAEVSGAPRPAKVDSASSSSDSSSSGSYSYSYSDDASDSEDSYSSETDTAAPVDRRTSTVARSSQQHAALVRASTSTNVRGVAKDAVVRSASARVGFASQAVAVKEPQRQPVSGGSLFRSSRSAPVAPSSRSNSVVLRGQYRATDGSVVKVVGPHVEITAGDSYTPSTPVSASSTRRLFDIPPKIVTVPRSATWVGGQVTRQATSPLQSARANTLRVRPGAATAALDARAASTSMARRPTSVEVPPLPSNRPAVRPSESPTFNAQGTPARMNRAPTIVVRRPDGSMIIRPAPAVATQA